MGSDREVSGGDGGRGSPAVGLNHGGSFLTNLCTVPLTRMRDLKQPPSSSARGGNSSVSPVTDQTESARVRGDAAPPVITLLLHLSLSLHLTG